MDFAELQSMCQRAGKFCLSKTKLAVTSLVVVLCGLLVVFCHSFGIYSGAWIDFSLTFLPLFVSGGLLMGLVVVLIRSYHDEVKEKDRDFKELFARSWHAALSSAYVFMPIVLVFLSIWAALGLFYLVREIPLVGDFFASILSSGPFLLHLAALLLGLFSVYVLFVVSPFFALKSFFEASLISQESRIYLADFFLRMVALFTGVFPLVISVILLTIAAKMTTHGYVASSNYLQMVVQWLMIMVPYAILLSPSIVFFFNMAAETHVLVHKNTTDTVKQ
jgi:hypothetical protein